ncbi:MAG TPA: maleylpyruvate isomerase N-terminal domain-containing protein [Acidimicrobiales bacterium]|nr:maleylpyruvate isomerase N-terminal domain-containing protein [Acidimicrobiales bacterium]
MVPTDDIARVADAQARFDIAIAGLTDADVGRPTTLPGWSVGHVLSHVARNADSHVRRTRAAQRGEVVEQYPGGFEGRAAEIEAGAHRSAAELIADVRTSGAAVLDAWRSVPADAWGRPTTDVGGRDRPLWQLVGRRWQELEVHVIDLDVGVTHDDWPGDFVAVWTPRLRQYFGDDVPVSSGLTAREELAWLYGRLARPDLPVPPPWG